MSMHKNDIITIDGPVGSGKSTVGRLVAERLGLVYLDTGAMYRVIALESRKRGISPDDADRLASLCGDVQITFRQEPDGQRVFSGEADVSSEIRTPEISMLASRISALGPVRRELVALQRRAGQEGGIVVDGRDAGTVIFPRARYKYYLDAAVAVRAERRYKELVEKNMKVEYSNIFNDVVKRDRDDAGRKESPLKPAPDADIVDTTGMTIEDVVAYIAVAVTA